MGRAGTVTDQRIAALDGLRGMAIAYVVLGHFSPEWLKAAGSFGVTLFFALSGRLMADVLFIGNMDWREFAVRRVARLYPALLVFLITMFIVSEILGRTDLLVSYWCYPIFAVNFVASLQAKVLPFDHLWSVSLEVQTYVVLAFIATGLSGRKRHAALLIGAVFCFTNGLVRTYIAHQNPFMVYWRPDVGAAVVFAAAFFRLLLKDVHVAPWTIPVALCTANGLMLFTTEPWISVTLNGLLLAFVGATADRSASPLLSLLQSPPLIYLGTISYSLYIWQQLFMYAHRSGFPLLAALVASLLTAAFSYNHFERPGKNAILLIWRRYLSKATPCTTHH